MTNSTPQIAFYCAKCFEIWSADDNSDAIILGDTCACPVCGNERDAVVLKPWMKGLCAAHKTELTEEGKEICRIAGARAEHPGPKTAATKYRCSMNGFKNGAYAKKHRLPPARPGTYFSCKSCPFAPVACNSQGDDTCRSEKWNYCNKRGETIISVINAHRGEGPAAIADMLGALQGMAMSNLQDALDQVAVDGPTIESDIIKMDDHFDPVILGTETKSHPGLKAVEVFSNMLGVNLAGSNLTAKSTTEKQSSDNVHDLLQALLPKSS